MNMPFKQDARLGRLETVLGKDKLVLLRFDGSDHVNGLFDYHVEALSTEQNIDFDQLIGTHASIEMQTRKNGPRWFDGIVTQARWAGVGENGNLYRLTLKPWLWIARQRRQQRIFHTQTAPEIIETVLGAYARLGRPHLELRLGRTYPELEYTVQYRESDMAFACRLMERFGISYHFIHKQGNHTAVLTDSIEKHDNVPGGSRPYKGVDGHHQADEEHFWEWHPERNLVTGAVRLIDYNFKTPTAAMEVDQMGDAAYAEGQHEAYDYPGDYLDQGEGRGVANLRTLQERGQDRRHRAVGDCTALGAGMRLSLTGDQVPGVKGTNYLCLSANHSYVSDSYGSGGPVSDGYAYTGSYVMMPADAPLAPRRKSPMPTIQGPQTATVVGEGEIDCDEYGRILVQFHWDLEAAHSMRCRVAQISAGKGWGGMVIPRIGMEVVVEFLEGDPDKPLVTGCVYNGKNDVPYGLPGNKTRTTIKSQTHQGAGYNELRFEDQADQEEIFMHAQKDHNTVIENDETHQILNDRMKSVTRNQTESIGNNKTISVGNDHHESVDGEKSETIKRDYSTTVTEGDQSVTVLQGMHTTTVESDQRVTVKTGNQSTVIETGDQTTTVETGDRHVQVLSAGHYRTVKNDIVTVSESGAVVVKAAQAVILEAPNIVLKADDANFISVSQGAVVIEGSQTLINPREAAPET